MANLAKEEYGASRTWRLDPYQNSHRLEIGSSRYKLDRNGAVVKKTLSCGLPLSIAVPRQAFKGVAARAIEDDAGNVTVTLELLHHDTELCIPLLHANDMDDVAADWHSWSRRLNLPMLLIGVDGEPSPVQNMLGEIMVEDPIARRLRITGVKWRPRFLRRRKQGVVGEVERVSASEIIARN